MVIHATVTSKLDYCNMLYAGLPLKALQKQQVGPAAANLLVSAYNTDAMADTQAFD